MINSPILLIYHSISDWGISFIASVSWSSALLMSGSLQQNVIDAANNEWRKRLKACMLACKLCMQHCRWTTFWTYCELFTRL